MLGQLNEVLHRIDEENLVAIQVQDGVVIRHIAGDYISPWVQNWTDFGPIQPSTLDEVKFAMQWFVIGRNFGKLQGRDALKREASEHIQQFLNMLEFKTSR